MFFQAYLIRHLQKQNGAKVFYCMYTRRKHYYTSNNNSTELQLIVSLKITMIYCTLGT